MIPHNMKFLGSGRSGPVPLGQFPIIGTCTQSRLRLTGLLRQQRAGYTAEMQASVSFTSPKSVSISSTSCPTTLQNYIDLGGQHRVYGKRFVP